MPSLVLVLGIAQDAGLPQAGCNCANCAAAWAGRIPRGLVSSIAVIDREQRGAWLIDATPDFPAQLHLLREIEPGVELRGIFLTHLHMGHYAGLVHLGRESMNVRGLPVHATPVCLDFLRRNGPWSQLLELDNVTPVPLSPGVRVRLTGTIAIEPVAVPHRAEYSDTVAYRIQGPSRALFYCPDIDRWEVWERDVREYVGGMDVALLDGTFFSAEELPLRNLAEIPHPPVQATVERLRGLQTEVRFLHLNHSNPLYTDAAERRWLRDQGFDLARPGDAWGL